MLKGDFNDLFDSLITDCKKALLEKGHDYTQDSSDKLANFKRIGQRLGVSPLVVAGIFFQKHTDALDTFIQTGAVASEPLRQRVVDIINYAALIYALTEDGVSANEPWSLDSVAFPPSVYDVPATDFTRRDREENPKMVFNHQTGMVQ